MTWRSPYLLLAALAATGSPAQTSSDGAFMKCRACHSLSPAASGMAGPSLGHLIGRKAGSLPDFPYSPAMKASTVIWTRETLDAFLHAPAKTVPGNRMPFPGIASDAERAAVIDLLAAH